MKRVGVILAGGSGSRFGGDRPKQFLEFAGKTVLEHTTGIFETHPGLDEVGSVSKAEFIPEVRAIVRAAGFRKVADVLQGGMERYHSTLAAVDRYADEDILIIHDAVRPLLSHRILDDCLSAMELYDAVDVAVRTTDTIIQVDDRNCIHSVPVRSQLRNGQTPQCFRRKVLREAYAKALADPSFRTTDDCGTVLRYLPDTPVYVVEGDVIVTSGFGGVYPKGIIVGLVSSLKNDDGGLLKIGVLEAAVDFQKLEDVMVITASREAPPEPIKPPTQTPGTETDPVTGEKLDKAEGQK